MRSNAEPVRGAGSDGVVATFDAALPVVGLQQRVGRRVEAMDRRAGWIWPAVRQGAGEFSRLDAALGWGNAAGCQPALRGRRHERYGAPLLDRAKLQLVVTTGTAIIEVDRVTELPAAKLAGDDEPLLGTRYLHLTPVRDIDHEQIGQRALAEVGRQPFL